MPITVACPDCENHFKVKDELVGGKIRCPKCASVVTVADEEEIPVRKQPRSKARKKAAGGRGLLIGLGVGIGVLVLFLGVGTVALILYLRQGGKAGSDTEKAGADTSKGRTDTGKGSDTRQAGPNLVVPILGGVGDNPKVTEDNFDRVTKEMSREQVEAMLGPGERIPRTEIYKILHQPTPAKVTDKTTVVKWRNGSDTILLEWLPEGTIIWSSYVRDQGPGKQPKSKGLGFPRLE
jgi:predicted Zn finger-like uncharacterized protein